MEQNRFRDAFHHKRVLLPVIHAVNVRQVGENVAIAHGEGADGAFLINHDISVNMLLKAYEKADRDFPDFWMGLNLLGASPIAALDMLPKGCGGLWVDNAGVKETGSSEQAASFLKWRTEKHSAWQGLYFGGVAFKYQMAVEEPACAARVAVPYVDVVTTSGAATGKPPEVAKIRLMREAIEEHPLAIASGITPENVEQYLPYTDAFLVASGISDSFTELSPVRTRALAKKIHDAH